MIDAAGYLDWCTHTPGPTNKVYEQANAGVGIALHSMEGGYDGSLRGLMNPERQASWMFSNRISGEMVQHYPVTASCWASGNSIANTALWSVESEGQAGQPLNEAQVRNMLRLCEEFEAYRADKYSPKRALREPLGGRTLWEHRECATWTTPNAGPTSCPSGRYQPFYDALEGGLSMEDKARLARLERLLGGNGIDYEGERLVGEAALAKLDERGMSLFLGLAETQNIVAGLALKAADIAQLQSGNHEDDMATLAAGLRELADKVEAP